MIRKGQEFTGMEKDVGHVYVLKVKHFKSKWLHYSYAKGVILVINVTQSDRGVD